MKFSNRDLCRTVIVSTYSQGLQSYLIAHSAVSETVIPNPIIEKLARSILTNATVLWLQGSEQCLDTELNLNTLKTVLIEQNEQELASWLDPFTNLTMHNDLLWPHSDPTDVFIKLE